MKLCSCHQHDLRELLPYSILMEITWFQRKFWLFFCHSGARISSHFSFLKRGMQFTIYIVALCTSWTASLPSCGRGEIVAREKERKDRPLCSLYTPPLQWNRRPIGQYYGQVLEVGQQCGSLYTTTVLCTVRKAKNSYSLFGMSRNLAIIKKLEWCCGCFVQQVRHLGAFLHRATCIPASV